jgi:hypothetical protein
MTFKEKSKNKTNGKSMTTTDVCTFTDVVDKTFDELMDRQIKYSIRRIQELEDSLSLLEQELDEFLNQRTAR